MKLRELNSIIAVILLILTVSCEQSDPPNFGRTGDVVSFSGRNWDVKSGPGLQGPGPNYFSDFAEDVFVDSDGHLHMRIAEHDGIWYASEIVSQDTMGYGTYSFTVEGDFTNIAENVVVGLFTWDNNTFYEQANSEVDIEFSKWGNANQDHTLQYGVQPINFEGGYFPERDYESEDVANLIGITTHTFHWTDTIITWNSYTGETATEAQKYDEWSFDLNNPPRIKVEGGNQSLPIVIPAPGSTTNARINFWILPWISEAPTNGETHEFIVRNFTYTPIQ